MRASDLRARADEMAALLDEAAPRARRQRRRRSTALPAAVAAFGALSVGGVGLALGLTPTGAEGQLPAAPSPVLADPATELPGTTTGGAPETADLDPAVAGADLLRPDDRREAAPGGPARTDPSSGTPRSTSTTTSSATSTTTTKPRPTRSTTPRPTRPPRPTVTRSATPRSTTTTPTSTAAPRRVAERSELAGPTVTTTPSAADDRDTTDATDTTDTPGTDAPTSDE
ncbi:hypothetical protein [Actinomycetospora soli]|uniref:hypothetical protein n=1 Tax=Actinomycetospora soli TaxID=2893887 RepID=UPI001E429B4D|nr:hypothetical protein [Actinomycetospora soli]MCD2190601.1 hypothetical protein [Actinomycetospora soli]